MFELIFSALFIGFLIFLKIRIRSQKKAPDQIVKSDLAKLKKQFRKLKIKGDQNNDER